MSDLGPGYEEAPYDILDHFTDPIAIPLGEDVHVEIFLRAIRLPLCPLLYQLQPFLCENPFVPRMYAGRFSANKFALLSAC